MDIIRKANAKFIFPGLDLKELIYFDKKNSEYALYNIYGMATSYRSGEGTYGPWFSLRGDFGVETLLDYGDFKSGTEYRSAEAFLPTIVNDLYVSDVMKALNAEGSKNVKFALKIGVRKADNPIGYEYTVKSLMEKTDTDMLSAIKNEVLPSKGEVKQVEKKSTAA